MLDLSESNMRDLIIEALYLRRQVTNLSMNRRRRYASSHYREDWVIDGDGGFENYPWEFITNTHPELIYSNPSISVTSGFGPAHPEVEALSVGMNAWCQDVNLTHVLNLIALDTFFDFGVSMVRLDALPGYVDDPSNEIPPPLRPVVERISPRKFFADARADSYRHARFMGHMWTRDKDDLLKAVGPDGSPMFDPQAVNQCAEDVWLSEEDMPESRRGRFDIPRHRVIGYEFYVPETGMIYTMGFIGGDQAGVNAIYIRQPFPYFGHRRGPYTLWGIHWVPDQIYPLPHLAITEDLEAEINAHAGQMSEDAGSAKRVFITNGDVKTTEMVESAANGSVLVIPGFDPKQAMSVEYGGAQPANMQYTQLMRERLDRKGGLTDLKRGTIQSGVTATQSELANAGTDVRMNYMRTQFKEACVDMLEKVMYLMHESDQVQFWVSQKDPQTGQEIPQIFVGGDHSQQSGVPHIPFEAMQIKIEPYSMEYVDDSVKQRRVMETLQASMQIIQFGLQVPAFKTENALDDIAESQNIKSGGDRYLDYGLFRRMQAMNMMMQMQQQQMAMQEQQQGISGGGSKQTAEQKTKARVGHATSRERGQMVGAQT